MEIFNKGTVGSRSEKLRITGIGSIGIGITNPATDVDISQDRCCSNHKAPQHRHWFGTIHMKNTTNNALEYMMGHHG